jgi:Tfp pilus assembly protein PilO
MALNNQRNLVGSVILALAMLLFWALVMPERRKVSEFHLALEARQSDLNQRLETSNKIKQIKEEAIAKDTDIKNLGLIVPSKKDVAELISAFDKISSISGMQLLQINIQPQANVPTDPLNGISLSADIMGDFNSIKTFLENIEQNIRLLDIDNIQVAPGSEGSPSGSQVKISLQAKAYFLK